MLRKLTRPRDPSTPATAFATFTATATVPQTSPPQPSTAPLTSEARRSFQEGFQKFERTVKSLSEDDHRDFSSTTLEDVRTAARQVEQQLAARQCLRNLHRIQPLLNGLERYSKVVEVLCNGTPYLPWIWAPIKLFVQLSMDFQAAFDKLIDAYVQIAENLPRFDRLSLAYRNSPDFQRVLSVVYRDILEFHRRAYKFFKCSGWKCFFKSSWGGFEARFKCILESLSRHSDLVDREANALLIEQTMQWREQSFQDMERRDQERAASQVTAVQNWLGIRDDRTEDSQEDHLDRIASQAYPGTADWILQHQKMKSWLKKDTRSPILWLKGKPGSGKTTLCAQVVRFLSKDRSATILFCFYSYLTPGKHPSIQIFATLVSQILRLYPHLSAYVYEDYLAKGSALTLQNLKTILSNLLSQVKAPRILIDGIDECIDHANPKNPQHHNLVREVLRDLLPYGSQNHEGNNSRLFIVSRDIPQVAGILGKKPTLALDDESAAVNSAIRSYTLQRLQEMQTTFESIGADDDLVKQLEHSIVQKSQGMFLWVQLVLSDLEDDVFSLQDLKTAIARIPTGLNDFYYRIVCRLKSLSMQSQARALHILEWMVCMRRPLRAAELQDGLTFSENATLNDENKLPEIVLHVCKPLIQFEQASHGETAGTVKFIHFTVQEYLRSALSGPFVDILKAECNVASACLRYLNFSKVLVNARIPEKQRTINVGKGFHSLHLYVNEYWLDHLLTYVSINEGLNLEKAPELHRQLIGLLRFISLYQAQIQPKNPRRSTIIVSFTESTSVDSRLRFLKQYQQLYTTLGEIQHYREIERRMFTEETDEILKQDPTPLSKLMESYSRRVQILLASETFPGLTTQLATFKAIYGPFAFTCRFPGCPKSSEGFATDKLRSQHEKLHAPSLVCTHSGCTYRLAFSSVRSLNRHVRENHETVSVVPRSIRGSRGISTKRQIDSNISRNSHHSASTGSQARSHLPRHTQPNAMSNARYNVVQSAEEASLSVHPKAKDQVGATEGGNINFESLEGPKQIEYSQSVTVHRKGLVQQPDLNPDTHTAYSRTGQIYPGQEETLSPSAVFTPGFDDQSVPLFSCVTCYPSVEYDNSKQYADHLIQLHPWGNIRCQYCSDSIPTAHARGTVKFANLFAFLEHIDSLHHDLMLVAGIEVALKKQVMEGLDHDVYYLLLNWIGKQANGHFEKHTDAMKMVQELSHLHRDTSVSKAQADSLFAEYMRKYDELIEVRQRQDYIRQQMENEEQLKQRLMMVIEDGIGSQNSPNELRQLDSSGTPRSQSTRPEEHLQKPSLDFQFGHFQFEDSEWFLRSQQPPESRKTPGQLPDTGSAGLRLRRLEIDLEEARKNSLPIGREEERRNNRTVMEPEKRLPSFRQLSLLAENAIAEQNEPLHNIQFPESRKTTQQLPETDPAGLRLREIDLEERESLVHGRSHGLQPYQIELMLLEQQNKKRLLRERQGEGSVNQQLLEAEKPRNEHGTSSSEPPDYQTQLMMLEQQNKERLLMARQEQNAFNQQLSEGAKRRDQRGTSLSKLQKYQIQLEIAEQQNLKSILKGRQQQEALNRELPEAAKPHNADSGPVFFGKHLRDQELHNPGSTQFSFSDSPFLSPSEDFLVTDTINGLPSEDSQLITISPRDALLDYSDGAECYSPGAKGKGKQNEAHRNIFDVSANDTYSEFWEAEISQCRDELGTLAVLEKSLMAKNPYIALNVDDPNYRQSWDVEKRQQNLDRRILLAEEKLKNNRTEVEPEKRLPSFRELDSLAQSAGASLEPVDWS